MTAEPPAEELSERPETSSVRLRLGVFLILVWWAPIWLLAPAIADGLSGMPAAPSVGLVTGVIVVIQTIIGLLGFWVAGSQVKKVIDDAPTKRVALGQIWTIFRHGSLRDPSTDEHPTDDQPTDAKPTDDQPTDAKPTDDQPTDAKPTDAKPTDDHPTGDRDSAAG